VKERAIVQQALGDLRTALPQSLTIRTEGGDGGAGPPLCILDWNATRRRVNGHNPFAGVIYDSQGNAIGRELHRNHEMELDITIRAYDESDRDEWLSDVADHFLAYEYDASAFNDDTTEWEVGDPAPRSNPVVEPDWYESGLVVRFMYVSRVEQSADALRSVQKDVWVHE
jgi:hypothetical protein